MAKRTISLIFSIVFVLLAACASKNDSVHSYGDEVTKDTLRICVDSGQTNQTLNIDQEYDNRRFFQGLAEEIKSACGIEEVVFEILPQEGAERETTLQRLRTEIMAGGGPDVFLMNTVLGSPEQFEGELGAERKYALFNFPEKNMESGLFLPLDEYMENHTQFTDWSNQTKAVMDAGRTDEGQVVIPLTYTFPVYAFPANEVKVLPSSLPTMQEILSNPETADLGAALYSDMDRSDELGNRKYKTDRLFYTLGKYADYETEELLFTEEELYEALTLIIGLRDDVEKSQLQYFEYDASYWSLIKEIALPYFDTEMTLVPMYSIDGGVTVSIESYAAVNRNTKFPEEAFSFVDYIMQEDMQRKSELYNSYFGALSLPMQHDLGQEGKSLNAINTTERVLAQPYFEDLLEIKENVTAANFQNELDTVLFQLMYNCQISGSVSHKAVSEAYEKMERMMGE